MAIAALGIQMIFHNGSTPTTVLNGVDLRVARGEFRLLMGPSGSGKTTLLSILAGILTPTAGTVKLLDRNITQLGRKALSRFRRSHIGFVFQDFNLFPALTASENIQLALKVKGITGRAAETQAADLLASVGLGDRLHHLPEDLSGGQKQRVAIARALADNPPLLFADEPTSSLDSHAGYEVVSLLHSLAKEQGTTVLAITHDPRITDLADRITYIEDGVITREPSAIAPELA